MLSTLNPIKARSDKSDLNFHISHTANNVLLFGSQQFLEEKLKVITEYTNKVDPFYSVEKITINEATTLKEATTLGFTHYIIVNKVFPRLVQACYGDILKDSRCFGQYKVSERTKIGNCRKI
jgi:hypothetical protein